MQKKKFIVYNSNVICFPIEIKVREFVSKIFLAYKLIKNTNFKVIIGGQRFITNKLVFKDCLWFDKNTFYKQREKFPIHKDNKIIMLDEEGPISFFSNANLKLRYNFNIIKQINTFLFSGRNDFKNLNHRFLKHKFKIFGNPKFDLIKSGNIKIFNSEIKLIKENYKDFIFIPGHWSSIKTHDIIKKNSELLFTSKLDQSSFQKTCGIYLSNYYSLLDLVKKIAIQNPNLTIVFRRHPSDSEYFIGNYFKDKPSNLKLVYKYSITPWIIACKFYLHSGCQSYLEALSLKKKIISYYPIKYKHTDNFFLSKPLFHEEKNCLNFFKKKIINKKKCFFQKKNISYVVKNINDNVTFHKEFSNFLNKNFKSKKSNIILKSEIKGIHVNILNFIYYFLSKFKNFFIKNRIFFLLNKFFSYEDLISKDAKNNKFRSLLKSEIVYYLDMFKKIDKSNNDIVVKKLSENVFLLHK
jgi:surface carbohydrate biosynthesis protein